MTMELKPLEGSHIDLMSSQFMTESEHGYDSSAVQAEAASRRMKLWGMHSFLDKLPPLLTEQDIAQMPEQAPANFWELETQPQIFQRRAYGKEPRYEHRSTS